LLALPILSALKGGILDPLRILRDEQAVKRREPFPFRIGTNARNLARVFKWKPAKPYGRHIWLAKTEVSEQLYLFFPICFNIIEFIASIGNSINGPITNTSDTTGCKGNVTTAIANETGELRADVVNINEIIFLNGNFNNFPAKNEKQKMKTKNINNRGNNFINNIMLSSNSLP
jgi:hypothetical protein